MIYPPPLRPGSRIRVVVPASPVKLPYMERGLAWLAARGWRPEWSGRGTAAHFYTAGPDAERAAELVEAFADPAADAVWFARGGYGCARLIPALERALPRPSGRPKTVVGCSDATALLVHLLQRWGWVVFHGPMVAGDLGRDPLGADGDYLAGLLAGAPPRAPVATAPLEVLRGGPAVTAPLTGGCLSVLAATLGTPGEWETDGRILFLEDTQIKPYQLDRLLWQLRTAGKLDTAVGIVFGEMTGCVQHPDQGYTIQEALGHALDGVACPVLFGLPSGHTGRPSLPLALGAAYRLDPAAGQLCLADDRLCPR
jgi:muramoyltetrapeptide carboxypeptidase